MWKQIGGVYLLGRWISTKVTLDSETLKVTSREGYMYFGPVAEAADPTFDMISASTLADLRDDVLYDCFFVDTAWQRKMRVLGALDEFLGGSVMQTPFMYDRVNGGAYPPGSDVTVVQKQILAATAFVPKAYKEDVPLNLFQTNVIQGSGPAVKVKLVDAYMANAVQALNTDIAIDFYRHGQNISGSNRQIFINGASEALNDGVNPSWDGNVFTTYGGQLRNGAITVALNSIPTWVGDQNGNPGQITYKVVVEAYLNCVQRPDTGLCNKALFGYLLERQEPKQRFTMERDVTIGFEGLKVLDGLIFEDKLAPSTKYGQILASGLSQTTSIKPTTFTTPSLTATQRAISNYPSSTLVNPAEPFLWLRVKGWKIRPSADPEYNFNFTPPIRSQTNPDLIVMFLKAALNIYTTQPRDNWQLVGAGF
jgi:hypothetical protein